MCYEHAMIIPYLLELFLVIYVLRPFRDYLPVCLFSLMYKNVIKIHFAMKTLKKSKHGNVGVINKVGET